MLIASRTLHWHFNADSVFFCFASFFVANTMMHTFAQIVDFQCNFLFNTSFCNLLRYKWIYFDRQFPETFHCIELNWNALIPLNLNETFKSAFVLCDGHSGGFETFSVNKLQSHVKKWIKKIYYRFKSKMRIWIFNRCVFYPKKFRQCFLMFSAAK